METLSDMIPAAEQQDWTQMRRHNDRFAALVANSAEIIAKRPYGSSLAEVVCASTADLIAMKQGVNRPDWVNDTGPLTEPLRCHGSVRRQHHGEQCATPLMHKLGLLISPESFFPIRNWTNDPDYAEKWTEKEWITRYLKLVTPPTSNPALSTARSGATK